MPQPVSTVRIVGYGMCFGYGMWATWGNADASHRYLGGWNEMRFAHRGGLDLLRRVSG